MKPRTTAIVPRSNHELGSTIHGNRPAHQPNREPIRSVTKRSYIHKTGNRPDIGTRRKAHPGAPHSDVTPTRIR